MKKNKYMNEKLNKIFDNYSHDIQRKKLAEEQYELLEALFIPPITFASTNQKENLITEIADNYVLIKQFMNKYNITDKEILEEANRKIDRQLERIKVENLLKKEK